MNYKDEETLIVVIVLVLELVGFGVLFYLL